MPVAMESYAKLKTDAPAGHNSPPTPSSRCCGCVAAAAAVVVGECRHCAASGEPDGPLRCGE